MSTNDEDSYSLGQMFEDEFNDMLFDDDYDPSTDACGLLWPVMSGIFAEELADLVMRKDRDNLED